MVDSEEYSEHCKNLVGKKAGEWRSLDASIVGVEAINIDICPQFHHDYKS